MLNLVDRNLVQQKFPALARSNWVQTSAPDARYNCIAWAAGDNTKWWWPEKFQFWPPGVPREPTISAFIAAFATVGYVPCADGQLDPNYNKVAIYALSNGTVTHAARQLPNGNWTSKLGPQIDLTHELNGLNGQTYGMPKTFLQRSKSLD